MDNHPNMYEIEIAEEIGSTSSNDLSQGQSEFESFLNTPEPIVIKGSGHLTL